jgi:hypothetical protein
MKLTVASLFLIQLLNAPSLFAGGSRQLELRTVEDDAYCATVYEYPDGGRYTEIGINELIDLHGVYLQRRKWNGSLRGWSGEDQQMADRVSAINVQKSCSLTLWEHPDRSGQSRTYRGTSSEAITFLRTFNNVASEAACTCEDDQGSVNNGSGKPMFLIVPGWDPE